MAISSTQSSITFVGNGSTSTAYAIPFRFDDPSWLSVVRLDAAGTPFALSLGTGFTVVGQNLKTVVAIPITETLQVLRFTPIVQTVQSSSPVQAYATAVEAQLDRDVMALQDLQRASGTSGAQAILTQAALAAASAAADANNAQIFAGEAEESADLAAASAAPLATALNVAKFFPTPSTGLRNFASRLIRGDDAAMLILSDSTGAPGWVTYLNAWIQTKAPNHRFEYRQLNGAGDGMDLTVIQAGSLGERRIYVQSGALYGRYMLPQEGRISTFTGVQVVAWQNSVTFEASQITAGQLNQQTVLNGWKNPSNARNNFQIFSGGTLGIEWQDNVGGFRGLNASTILPISLVAGTRYDFRAVLIANTGSGTLARFFYSTNQGVTWTQIGSDVTNATAVVFAPVIENYFVGQYGGTPVVGTRFYSANILIGTNAGTVVSNLQPILPQRIELYRETPGAIPGSMLLEGSPTIHVDNVARSGGGFANGGWFQVSFPGVASVLIKDRPYDICLLNDGHNEIGVAAKSLAAALDAGLAVVNSYLTQPVPVVVMTQNPEAAAFLYSGQAQRRTYDMVAYAQQRNYAWSDVNAVFRAYPGYPGTLPAILADNLHPNSTGYALWFNNGLKPELETATY